MRDGWIIYAIFGVLVCLLLWRVATQWKVKSAEPESLRASLIILGAVAFAFVVWQFVQQASPIAVDSQDKTITVFAAASMKNALDEVDASFTEQTGIKVVSSYDASSALMKQIEGDAAADAFISADLKWMDYGVEKKVINESTRITPVPIVTTRKNLSRIYDISATSSSRSAMCRANAQYGEPILPHCMSLLLAQSGHSTTEFQCPLLG